MVLNELGQTEYKNLRNILGKVPQNQEIHYLNLRKHVWSEWGLLQIMSGKDIHGIYDETQLKRVLSQKSGVIIVENRYWLEQLNKNLVKHPSAEKKKLVAWDRWRIHGKDENGQSLWTKFLEERDYNVLQKQAYILYFSQRENFKNNI